MLMLLLAIHLLSDRCITSCNYNLDICYFDEKSCNVKSVRCEDVTLQCKPVHVNLGEWNPKYENSTSWPHVD